MQTDTRRDTTHDTTVRSQHCTHTLRPTIYITTRARGTPLASTSEHTLSGYQARDAVRHMRTSSFDALSTRSRTSLSGAVPTRPPSAGCGYRSLMERHRTAMRQSEKGCASHGSTYASSCAPRPVRTALSAVASQGQGQGQCSKRWERSQPSSLSPATTTRCTLRRHKSVQTSTRIQPPRPVWPPLWCPILP